MLTSKTAIDVTNKNKKLNLYRQTKVCAHIGHLSKIILSNYITTYKSLRLYITSTSNSGVLKSWSKTFLHFSAFSFSMSFHCFIKDFYFSMVSICLLYACNCQIYGQQKHAYFRSFAEQILFQDLSNPDFDVCAIFVTMNDM